MSGAERFEATGELECEHDCGCVIKPGDRVAYERDTDAVICLACAEEFEKVVAAWTGDVPGRIFRAGDRVEWNPVADAIRGGDPTGDEWKPGTVVEDLPGSVRIALDEDGQPVRVPRRNLRQLGSVTSSWTDDDTARGHTSTGDDGMSAPEVRWCNDSGMVLRRCNDGTWAVLDIVGEADDPTVLASTRLLPPDGLRQEAEEIAGDITMDWNWYRATRRRYRIRTVLALAVGVALGAPLTRWSR